MYAFTEKMYPICRSITGQGVRETLKLISGEVGLKTFSIETGTKVFDWEVPKEWNIKEAYIKDGDGKTIVDFRNHNLHIMSYSCPVKASFTIDELRPHLHYLKEMPEVIPYRTSYYKEAWGFCLSYAQFSKLADTNYEVLIDSSLEHGVLDYGEVFIKGEVEDEVILYTHICHPSLGNDNLSGLSVLTHLSKILEHSKLKYSYRIVFAPGTIGSITWLSQNKDRFSQIKCGLVVALVGDSGNFCYKRNRNEDSYIDKVVSKALMDSGEAYEMLDFSPYGYDERQFCSPGINLDFGRLTRTPNSCYEEYHTSNDNLDFIKPDRMATALMVAIDAINIIEEDETYINTQPYCEPQLGRRGLYENTGGVKDVNQRSLAMLWVLNQSDGRNSLLDIAIRSGLAFESIYEVSKDLLGAGLLKKSEN
ncbi:MAG: DUF4910 domain-containing protein [Gammaproteobacteria bacterium]|nr:DUF4910 domain-containing protein [Gammaproteobacteria bacterium]